MPDFYQIAIDGHSSCGKSTLARDIAEALDILYIDSGAMYRAVSLFFIQNQVSLDKLDLIAHVLPTIHITFEYKTGGLITFLNGINVEQEIRDAAVASIVSPVAAIEIVRQYLVGQQRELGENQSVVMDGRDIGTVVFPTAHVKFFVTASVEVRTQRRWKELQDKQILISKEEVRDNLLSRDEIDSNRLHSPLVRAEDAILIDNTFLDRKQQLEYALDHISKRIELK